MMNKYRFLLKGHVLSEQPDIRDVKKDLETEFRRLRIVLHVEQLEVEPAKTMFTKKELT